MICGFTSCEQSIAREIGGTINIEVPKGQKVMMATWKGADLFYMTEPMEENYVPTTKTLHESKGNEVENIFKTTVVFKESK